MFCWVLEPCFYYRELLNNKIIMRYFFLIVGISSLFGVVSGQNGKKIPSEKPKLIVGIVISQMRQDYISRYWNKFGEDGIKKLINRGTYCKNTQFNYLFSDEGVGHATIATGTNPCHHGIVSDQWYNHLKERIITNIEDDNAETVGGNYASGKMSPANLLCTTYGDELKLSNNFKSKIIGISYDPSAAILSTGHSADAAYWFDVKTGGWITSNYYMDSLPAWVAQFNQKGFADVYVEQEWSTLLPISEYSESLPDKNGYEEGLREQTTFPYDLKELNKKYKKKDKYSILNYTPYGNNYTKDFVVSAIVEEGLGADQYTDILVIGFSAIENIGNLYGPHSVEVQDAMLRLDKDIAHLLGFIDETVGKENTLIYLTAEHGVAYNPKYLADNKIPVGYFDPRSSYMLLNSYMKNKYGRGDWVKSFHSQQIYLNRLLIEDADLNLVEVQNDVADFMLQFHGVANTITANTLQTTNFTDGIFYKVQNSFHQKRSGDILINLKAGWVEKDGGSTNHNSSYNYDSRVPLIWYGWKIGRKSITRPVDLTDIAPTISNFLEISYPNAATGVPIIELME